MSTFTLAISCLTLSNLPWFLDLTFQVPMEYCSLQHRTLLLSPVTSSSGYCFCFGSIPSFFLELFLHWSPVAYWASTDLGSSSFSILSFCLFILHMGFLRQEYIRWPKYQIFRFSISPSNEYSGLISFKIDRFNLLAVQGTLSSLLQHHSLKGSILWCSTFPALTTIHDHRIDYGLDYMDLCWQINVSAFQHTV